MRVTALTCATLLLASLGARAQPPPPAAPPAPRAPVPGDRERRPEEPQFDEGAVQRGQALLVARCGFCHGSNARGGSSGPDLTRSALIQEDENGKQLGEFLKVGRPEKNMPKFELAESEVVDVATFLHATIYSIGNRRTYQILDIVTGDPKAGAAFFNGAGRCASCHSVEGDLKGVASKYEPATLQGRVLLPRDTPRFGPGGRGAPPWTDRNAVKATVTGPAAAAVTGALVRLTDFDVTIYDTDTKQMRSWTRAGDVPRVTLADPLQGHVDLLRKWDDRDMHDVTAYLVSLK